MIFIMGLLTIIIILLLVYLFAIKKDLIRIKKAIIFLKNNDTNIYIHKELSIQELNHLIEEMNKLIGDYNYKSQEFKKKNEALKKMMINVSHDLRTPLTSALGYIDIILKNNLSKEEQEKDLKIIEERLQRLDELIDSFFEFCKILLNNKKIEQSKVNLIGIVEERIAHYYDDFIKENRNIILTKNISKYNVLTNRNMFIRIFDNIISNAYKHSKGDLSVHITKKNKLEIDFSNILLENHLDIDRIFDEFYTTDISRTKGNTGLGLAIVKEFVENLGGTIVAKKVNDELHIILKF